MDNDLNEMLTLVDDIARHAYISPTALRVLNDLVEAIEAINKNESPDVKEYSQFCLCFSKAKKEIKRAKEILAASSLEKETKELR